MKSKRIAYFRRNKNCNNKKHRILIMRLFPSLLIFHQYDLFFKSIKGDF